MTEEIAETETAPESPVKEEPEAVVEKANVTQEVTEAKAAQKSPKKNLKLLWRKPCDRGSYRS